MRLVFFQRAGAVNKLAIAQLIAPTHYKASVTINPDFFAWSLLTMRLDDVTFRFSKSFNPLNFSIVDEFPEEYRAMRVRTKP
ncbi:MAG: hypothetical protein B6D36_03105 [Planctomycetes bacterium UTPLA1]|nr:MAG: hypothetical protein B6D36_03105 [Planctomycetes bacterium UTPLA1]